MTMEGFSNAKRLMEKQQHFRLFQWLDMAAAYMVLDHDHVDV